MSLCCKLPHLDVIWSQFEFIITLLNVIFVLELKDERHLITNQTRRKASWSSSRPVSRGGGRLGGVKTETR